MMLFLHLKDCHRFVSAKIKFVHINPNSNYLVFAI